jgi:hypothetical protein
VGDAVAFKSRERQHKSFVDTHAQQSPNCCSRMVLKSRFVANFAFGFESEVKVNRLALQVSLADRQADPNSPLYSAKSFDELNLCVESVLSICLWRTVSNWELFSFRNENLIKGVYNMGFQRPSKIQERALPLLLQNPYVT